MLVLGRHKNLKQLLSCSETCNYWNIDSISTVEAIGPSWNWNIFSIYVADQVQLVSCQLASCQCSIANSSYFARSAWWLIPIKNFHCETSAVNAIGPSRNLNILPIRAADQVQLVSCQFDFLTCMQHCKTRFTLSGLFRSRTGWGGKYHPFLEGKGTCNATQWEVFISTSSNNFMNLFSAFVSFDCWNKSHRFFVCLKFSLQWLKLTLGWAVVVR